MAICCKVTEAKIELDQKQRKWSQVLALIPLYLLQISYGMNSGLPAILTPQLRENCSEIQIDDNQESWIVSLDNLVTPWICLLSGFLQLNFGPKRVLMMSCIPYFVAWLCVYFAESVAWLYASRFFVGISHALVATTVYTVEISSKDLRGTFSLLEAVLRCTGCVLIYVLGYFRRWHEVSLICLPIPLLAFILTFFVPESPTYLVAANKEKSALKSIQKLYGKQFDGYFEIESIKEGISKKNAVRETNCLSIETIKPYLRPEVIQPFLIVFLMGFVQQFSGMTILRSYVIKIFDTIFQKKSEPIEPCSKVDSMAYISAIIMGLARLLSSLLLSKLLMHFRRRHMYFISAFLTIVSLSCFATCDLLLKNDTYNEEMSISLKWLSLVFVCCLNFSVQLGVQTLPFLLSGELFPSNVRPTLKGITRSIQCLLLVGILKLYPIMVNSQLDVYGTFYLLASVLAFFVPIIYIVLPETKDLRLEQLQHYFTPARTIFYVDVESFKTDEKS